MSSAKWTVGTVSELVKRVAEDKEEEVWMRNVVLTEAGAKALADALERNTTLIELWMSECHITDGIMVHVTRGLRSSTCSVNSLNLSGNDIGDSGATILFSLLEVNKSLISLYLNGNRIGDVGIQALATMLPKNTTLQEIYLWDNQISDVGCEALANVLSNGHNTTILKLEIENGDADETNCITNKGSVHRILLALEKNATGTSSAEIKTREPSRFRRKLRSEVLDDDFDKA